MDPVVYLDETLKSFFQRQTEDEQVWDACLSTSASCFEAGRTARWTPGSSLRSSGLCVHT